MHKLMYMVMVGSEDEVRKAEILVRSIRQYGGAASKEPVIIVTSKGLSLNGLASEVQTIVTLDVDSSLRDFPFADKVFACARVEQIVRDSTEWLLWLNPDALMFAPPNSIINADKDKCVSIRSVHIANVGSAFDKPVDSYWSRIYSETGVDTATLWPVESLIDRIKLRPYFNSGCMAFRPEDGILQGWKDVFCAMLRNKELREYYSAENNRAIFFHQAVLSAVIISIAGKDRINILPDSYSYPLILQESKGLINRIDSIPGIDLVLCGRYENLNLLKIAEPYNSWIEANVTDLK